MQSGALDMAVVYNPPQRLGLVCELLLDEKLIMVTRRPDGKFEPEEYVQVDWGPNFAANEQSAFPDHPNPPVAISLGPLALTYILTVGGAGYFRAGTVMPFIADGTLFRVQGAPEFSHSAYVIYAACVDLDLPVLVNLRRRIRRRSPVTRPRGPAPRRQARRISRPAAAYRCAGGCVAFRLRPRGRTRASALRPRRRWRAGPGR